MVGPSPQVEDPAVGGAGERATPDPQFGRELRHRRNLPPLRGAYAEPVAVEPPPTLWRFPPVDEAEPGGLVGVGADLEPGTVLAAYRHGMFPMPLEPDGVVGWWSPDPRGVLEPGDLRVSRSLRRSLRRFEIRTDTAFSEVIEACADPGRPHGWIDAQIREAYLRLHELGWVHSVEAWRDGRLAGGLYGVVVGGLFAGESMFHRERDASKVALVALVDMLSDGHRRLIDVQWRTDHLASLGVAAWPRRRYLDRLSVLLDEPQPTIRRA
ncbi:MAG: leucyl/phenylalanyl-tRNA--protein transferase [Actinobacteria bacterium]|nr:leucyl/phenylalanyl-tRNA--protein transferase [Actinomycetota bacterium]NIS31163.1 leucyl/phenylalanyl-tRNA--protein transferase [Actinomycetota bacterium]NIT95511.1 leucyl/phenylalanyl-tRNA--protein transferase [Actinomycetota bacterium]NIU19206.1 leucyl/phenylalanyl-tRNA--protein transferase [Actinomycetota bacterium]NIU66308.1 leucyl/phenylalanyl-tRNA--protein transferase [Actinomycetota bacterium]